MQLRLGSWLSRLFVAASVLILVLCAAIPDTPAVLLTSSITVTVLAGLICCMCVSLLYCVIQPLVETIIKAQLDVYVDHLRAKLASDDDEGTD